MKIRINQNIFNEVYRSHLDTDTRFNVFYGGAGSGKSVFVVQKMIRKLLKERRKCLVVRKVAATLRDSIFAEFVSQLESTFKILDYCKVTESRLTIRLPNGSLFLFKGLDNPEKIKSISGIDDIVIEEATELFLDDFTQLNFRLRSKAENQQIHLMFNPISKANWVYKTFFEGERPGSTAVLHTTWQHNRFLPASYIEALEEMQKVNPTYYKIYALGEFATLDKLVYTNWRVGELDMKSMGNDWKTKVALDFGFTNDPTALICSMVNVKERKIYVYDEHFQTGMLNNHIAEMIKGKGLDNLLIRADSAEQKSIEEIRQHGVRKIVPAKKGPGSVMAGIQKLQQFEIIVRPNCMNLKEELENYSWIKDKHTNEYLNEPIDAFNHGLDALRYSMEDVNFVFDRKNYSGRGAR